LKHAVKQIRGKKPLEIYTPSGANKDDFTDRDEFERVVGNMEFHSFQVWRESAGAKATCVYALTLEQLEAIQKAHFREKAGLKGRVTRLARENDELRRLQTELEKLATVNQQLHKALIEAKIETTQTVQLAAALQYNVDVLAKRVPEEVMTDAHRSLTPSPAQLVVDARTDQVYGIVLNPTNGKPDRDRFTVNRYCPAKPPPKAR
jgi:hypothetical protein